MRKFYSLSLFLTGLVLVFISILYPKIVDFTAVIVGLIGIIFICMGIIHDD